MSVIALISCTKSKKDYACPAKELYSKSKLFQRSYQLANLVAEKTYFVSAKHGLVGENDILEPYDEALLTKSAWQIEEWALKVADSLSNVSDLNNDYYVILAGRLYYEKLLPKLKNYWLPLEGLRLFERQGVLDDLIEIEKSTDNTLVLHKLFNNLPRYGWNSIDRIPYQNGIYLFFEKGETFNTLDRVTRVGSHPSEGRLKIRLKDHFETENKDGSIFRKNIGRALLNTQDNPYLKVWNMNMSNSLTKSRSGHLVDQIFQKRLEVEVSQILRNKFSFTVFPVESRQERLRLEEGIIATLNSDKHFKPGAKWFGLSSPVAAIAKSGLWNVQGLSGLPLTESELKMIRYYVRFGSRNMAVNSGIRRKIEETSLEKAKVKKSSSKKVSSSNIESLIESLLCEARSEGKEYLELISGEIHKQLGLKNRMPQVCNALYKKMGQKDLVVKTTPSGYSSTIKIKYYLE